MLIVSPTALGRRFRARRLTHESFKRYGDIAEWPEDCCQSVVRYQIGILSEPFRFDARLLSAPWLSLVAARSSAVRMSQAKQIADGTKTITLHVFFGGGRVWHRRQEIVLQHGDAVLVSSAEDTVLTLPDSLHLSLHLNYYRLSSLIHDMDAVLMRRLPANTEALNQIGALARELDQPFQLSMDRRLIVARLYDLVALSLGASRRVVEDARRLGVRAARFAAMKAAVLTNLTQSNLSPKTIALAHAVSESYVRKLFAEHCGSFAKYVLDQRLQYVSAALDNPDFVDWPLGEIVADAGFNSMAYFRRAFYRRYSISPMR